MTFAQLVGSGEKKRSAAHAVSGTDKGTDTDKTADTAKAPDLVRVPRPDKRPIARRATIAQEGHSHAEQAVYSALWDAGTPEPGGSRTVTLGFGRMAKVARLTLNNCRLNSRSLISKLAIEEIGAEDCRERTGKTYRIFSYAQILDRRRAAGMEWYIRTKGVAFVDRVTGVPVSGTDAMTDIGGGEVSGTERVAVSDTERGSYPNRNLVIRKSTGEVCGACGGAGYTLSLRVIRGIGTQVRVDCKCRK